MSDQLKRKIQSMTQLGLSLAELRKQIAALTGTSDNEATGLSEDDLAFCESTGIKPEDFAKHHKPAGRLARAE